MNKYKSHYVGIKKEGFQYEYFSFEKGKQVTPEATPEYCAVIGPFKTKRGAKFCEKYGKGNPHIMHVDDAERLAIIAEKKTSKNERTPESYYLEWFNDFLTYEKFAEYYDISVEEATRIIEQGKRDHLAKHDKLKSC